jgi:hypothetical protein
MDTQESEVAGGVEAAQRLDGADASRAAAQRAHGVGRRAGAEVRRGRGPVSKDDDSGVGQLVAALFALCYCGQTPRGDRRRRVRAHHALAAACTAADCARGCCRSID